MALGKQAKTLTKAQVESVTSFLLTRRHGLRDQTVFLLSVRAGLRAKEIANLKWAMVLGADGEVGDSIYLTDEAAKGMSQWRWLRSLPIGTWRARGGRAPSADA